MRRTLALALALPLSLLALAGCEVSTGTPFEPRIEPGEDGVALRTSGPWKIDGEDATPALCEAAGIKTVQLVFVDGVKDHFYEEFAFPCGDGSYTSDGPVLAFGEYDVRWSALTEDGSEKATTNTFTLDASVGHTTVVVTPPNFPFAGSGEYSLTVDVKWDVAMGGDFSAGDCASATGLNSVTYALLDESTTPATLLAEQNDGACVDSLMFQMPEVTFDGTKNYTLQIHGGPNAAATYWEAECTGLMADDTGLHIETCFVDDVRPRMKVGLSWDADATEDFSGAGCATAGVSKITVKLRKSGAVSTVASYPNISCADSITFTAPEVELGTNYELEVTGGATDNATDWASTCTGLSAAAGAPMEWTCEIQHTAL